MTTIQQELGGSAVTVIASGGMAGGLQSRIMAGLVDQDMKVSAPAMAQEAGLDAAFNRAEAGVSLRGSEIVAAGAPAPTLPEQAAPAVQGPQVGMQMGA